MHGPCLALKHRREDRPHQDRPGASRATTGAADNCPRTYERHSSAKILRDHAGLAHESAMRRASTLLILLVLAGCAGRGTRPPGPPSDPWGPYISEAAQRNHVPEKWVRAVMQQESGGHATRNGAPITSSAGAIGLMQVMPDTYADLRTRYPLGRDPADPHDNIMAGTAYIREMYDRYGAPGFLAAYNAGPRRLDAYLYGNQSLPNETINYLAAIAPRIADTAPMTGPLAVFAENPGAPPPDAGSSRFASASSGLQPYVPDPVAPVAPAEPDGSAAPVASVSSINSAPLPPPVQVAEAPRTTTSSIYFPPANAPFQAATPVRAYSAAPVRTASAAPISAGGAPISAGGAWAVQLGAFGSPEAARHTADAARRAAPDLLAAATTATPATSPFGGHRLYRARLTGLTHNAAISSCARLGGLLPCIPIPPGGA